MVHEALERLDRGVQVVLGGRDLFEATQFKAYSAKRRVATLGFRLVVDAMLDIGVPDTQCGFKAFEGDVCRALFKEVTIDGFGFDVEVLFLARRWGLRMERIPAEMKAATHSSVRLFRDSRRMLSDVMRIKVKALRGGYPSGPR